MAQDLLPGPVVEWIHAIYLIRRSATDALDAPDALDTIQDPNARDLVAHLVDVALSESMYDAVLGIGGYVNATEAGWGVCAARARLEAGVRSALDRLAQLRGEPALAFTRLPDNITFLIGYGRLVVDEPRADDAEPF